jgi:hypothetical protein
MLGSEKEPAGEARWAWAGWRCPKPWQDVWGCPNGLRDTAMIVREAGEACIA